MEKTIITAIDEYTDFQLDVAQGNLKLVSAADNLEFFAIKRSDNSPFQVQIGQTYDVSDIHHDQIYVRMSGSSANPQRAEFSHSSSLGDHSFSALVIVPVVLIDCDADRDGVVGENEEGKANWTWGQQGCGAIVLVDNDVDSEDGSGIEEREPVIIRPTGINSLPRGYSLRLRTAAEGASNFSVLRKTSSGYEKVIGLLPDEPPQQVVSWSDAISLSGETLYVAAHRYPGPFFEGLILLNLEIVRSYDQGEVVVASDRVMLRAAPWVMTPNTQPLKKVYTCEVSRGQSSNQQFLTGLKSALTAIQIPLEVIPPQIHRGDRWIQDEIEIGYSRSPRGSLPVVFDSPRDRGLDDYPELQLLGSDFGHFVVGGGVANSLDSFGNLEVSPPVVVDGQVFPLGRIIVGGRKTGDFAHSSRQMMAEIRQFLYAQKVQFPFEIYTDWLVVAHVDEIISFVPDESSAKQFKMLIASPNRVKKILETLSAKGHGSVKMFEGKHRLDGGTAELTVDDLLSQRSFWEANAIFQSYMDENKAILKAELGLDDEDIVEIPTSFQDLRDPDGKLTRTAAFFPDMVNHLVHNEVSIVPKPYGPKVSGKCAFEKDMEDSLPGRRLYFIDDWYSYHEMLGEVHCGTNALREPFLVSKWWDARPEGGFDIKLNGLLGE